MTPGFSPSNWKGGVAVTGVEKTVAYFLLPAGLREAGMGKTTSMVLDMSSLQVPTLVHLQNSCRSDGSLKTQRTGLLQDFSLLQWLRICLLMQGIRIRSLVWEDFSATEQPSLQAATIEAHTSRSLCRNKRNRRKEKPARHN